MNISDSDALIVVDVQNDFCPGGALPVRGGDGVVTPLNRAMTHFENIAFTRDWHPDDHCSFEDAPRYVDGSWPMHCIQDTPGAEFHGGLRVPLDSPVISKGVEPDVEQYGGFERPELEAWLRKRNVSRVFIGGLATDYCVKATALGALNAGFETVILADACRGVDDQTTEAALREMKAAGVRLAQTGDLG